MLVQSIRSASGSSRVIDAPLGDPCSSERPPTITQHRTASACLDPLRRIILQSYSHTSGRGVVPSGSSRAGRPRETRRPRFGDEGGRSGPDRSVPLWRDDDRGAARIVIPPNTGPASALGAAGVLWTVLAVLVPALRDPRMAAHSVATIRSWGCPSRCWNPAIVADPRVRHICRTCSPGARSPCRYGRRPTSSWRPRSAIVIGYPVAYFLARCVRRGSRDLPSSSCSHRCDPAMRMEAWVGLLTRDGLRVQPPRVGGRTPVAWLSGRPIVVIIGPGLRLHPVPDPAAARSAGPGAGVDAGGRS